MFGAYFCVIENCFEHASEFRTAIIQCCYLRFTLIAPLTYFSLFCSFIASEFCYLLIYHFCKHTPMHSLQPINSMHRSVREKEVRAKWICLKNTARLQLGFSRKKYSKKKLIFVIINFLPCFTHFKLVHVWSSTDAYMQNQKPSLKYISSTKYSFLSLLRIFSVFFSHFFRFHRGNLKYSVFIAFKTAWTQQQQHSNAEKKVHRIVSAIVSWLYKFLLHRVTNNNCRKNVRERARTRMWVFPL